LPKTAMRLSLLHNKQMSVKWGGPFAYEKWGDPTFYFSKVGGSNFKVGGHEPPLSMVATPLSRGHGNIAKNATEAYANNSCRFTNRRNDYDLMSIFYILYVGVN